jgi:hypothetical protein
MATPDCWSFSRRIGNNVFQRPLMWRTIGGENMSPDDRKRVYRRDMLFASAMVAVGLTVAGLALAQLKASDPQMAQATQPLQSSPTPAPQNNEPAESKPGGERPTTPAPEPARPDTQAQKSGATPVLPPAPAEKTAAPIQQK